ncbi:MAG: hypothetical protein JXB13_15745 [Phycisphaerae bacterium]|nr:hypothetical protein [Phycisphaerae bacterium]
MTPQKKAGTEQRRKAYEKPRLRVIELNAEETLQDGCKQEESGSSPGGFTCVSNNCGKAAS